MQWWDYINLGAWFIAALCALALALVTLQRFAKWCKRELKRKDDEIKYWSERVDKAERKQRENEGLFCSKKSRKKRR